MCPWAQRGGNGAALDPRLCLPRCGRGSAPPLLLDLLLSARFCALCPSQGAFHSSACFHPFMFILLFSLTLLLCYVRPVRTFSCPRSWQDPSVPPTAMDDCHSATGDVTFPPRISCPRHPTSPSIPRQRDVSLLSPSSAKSRPGVLPGLFLTFA